MGERCGTAAPLSEVKLFGPPMLNRLEKLFLLPSFFDPSLIDDLLEVVDCDQRFRLPTPSLMTPAGSSPAPYATLDRRRALPPGGLFCSFAGPSCDCSTGLFKSSCDVDLMVECPAEESEPVRFTVLAEEEMELERECRLPRDGGMALLAVCAGPLAAADMSDRGTAVVLRFTVALAPLDAVCRWEGRSCGLAERARERGD